MDIYNKNLEGRILGKFYYSCFWKIIQGFFRIPKSAQLIFLNFLTVSPDYVIRAQCYYLIYGLTTWTEEGKVRFSKMIKIMHTPCSLHLVKYALSTSDVESKTASQEVQSNMSVWPESSIKYKNVVSLVLEIFIYT